MEDSTLEEQLAGLERDISEARDLAQHAVATLNNVKAGRNQVLSHDVAEKQAARFAEQLLHLEVRERKLHASIAARLEWAASAGSATASSSSAAAAAPSAPSSSALRVQLTIENWAVKRTADGKLVRPDGPKRTIAASPPSLNCEPCGRSFASIEGSNEHKRHCHKAREAERKRAAARAEAAVAAVGVATTAARAREEESETGSVSSSNTEDEKRRALAAGPQEATKDVVAGSGGKPITPRKVFSAFFKLRVARHAIALRQELGRARGANRIAANLFDVSEANASRWADKVNELEVDAKKAHGQRGRGHRGRLIFSKPRGPKPKWLTAEELVRANVAAARARGAAVSSALVRIWMRKAVVATYPNNPAAAAFKASRGWLNDFKARWGYVTRRRTNQKAKSVTARLPLVQAFHKAWQQHISSTTGANHPEFGRFAPGALFNADQSPLVLQPSSGTTLERAGAKTVVIASKESGDKRVATLQICVRLDGTPDAPVAQPPISIIFAGQGKRISVAERAGYDPRVHVMFQPKAWMDGATMVKWLDGVFVPFVTQQNVQDPVLFLDNLKAQSSDEMREKMLDRGVTPWFFPPNCTDIVQPVDRHLAQQVKGYMGRELEAKLAEDAAFAEDWYGLTNGTYPAWKCRVLLTRLAGNAWQRVCEERDMLQLGIETGCVMYRDGVVRPPNRAIKIVGVDNYAFEHVALKPPEGEGAAGAQAAGGSAAGGAASVSAAGGVASVSAAGGVASVSAAGGVASVSAAGGVASVSAAGGVASVSAAGGVARVSAAEAARLARELVGEAESDEEKETKPRPRVRRRAKTSDNVDSSSESDSEMEEDEDAPETFHDDTAEPLVVGAPAPPQGWSVVATPSEIPPVRRIVKSFVLFAVSETASGTAGWIMGQVLGGPPDPSAAALGITMRIKCSRRQDKNTPFHMDMDELYVAFSLANYGTSWMMLKKEEGDGI